MIERMAQAIANCNAQLWEVWPDNRPLWLQQARAAIEAMREPTKAMLDAAHAADGIFDAGSLALIQRHWELMIGAILSEKP